MNALTIIFAAAMIVSGFFMTFSGYREGRIAGGVLVVGITFFILAHDWIRP